MNQEPVQGGFENRYTYESAGFNGFLQRSIDMSKDSPSLDASQSGSSKQLDLDRMQATGGFGDTVTIGNIKLDGVGGKISIFDDNNNEVARLGKIDD